MMPSGAIPHSRHDHANERAELRRMLKEAKAENERLRRRIDQIRGMAEDTPGISAKRQFSDIRDACDAALNDS